MLDVKLFMFEGCPHCRRAREMLDEIFAEHPEYARVPFTVIDERIHPEIAERFDYYYVPTFYVGAEKIMEGVPEKAAIERAFAKALAG